MQPVETVIVNARNIVLLLAGIGVLLHLIFAVAAALVAKSKERNVAGWLLLGILFGFFAFLATLFLPKSEEPFGTGNVVGIVVVAASPLLLVLCCGPLAAISIPNFLTAQERAKVARVRSEMRVLATALETYYVDYSAYPSAETFPAPLTTPVAYMGSAPKDPFTQPPKDYGYRPQPVNGQEGWIVLSVGPDRIDNDGEIEYDLSNGTTSNGDIIRYADRF